MAAGDLLIGSLCSGAGGLDFGVQAALGGHIAWHIEADPRAAQVVARHWPRSLSWGDIRTIDGSQTELVCVLTAGFPCPGLSVVSPRTALARGTRSGLWHHIASTIRVLGPYLVIAHVRGLLSTPAGTRSPRPVEPCPRSTGGSPDQTRIRALSVLLADLTGLGNEWWAECLSAIRRWRSVIGGPALSRTVSGTRCLSPELGEWMLLPQRWVTGGTGLSRVTQLPVFGGAVVPAQAAHPLDILLHGGWAPDSHAELDGALDGGC
ncbi:hypothetical protein AQI95_33945 [Streptomyces yokosukanensis]|uniref:Uncharacterized protein n=1 Tax=Streptomyces yokosukanensis TaxID=67386 RepID=A0A101NWY0_9ACTN|nr:hypothetical protein AQI95_33945 [Streptomyces yokosukanensis]